MTEGNESRLDRLMQELEVLRRRLDSLGRIVVSLVEGQLAIKERLDALEGKPSLEQRVMFARRKFRNG